MVSNAILNNISAISWRSVLLVKEIQLPHDHGHDGPIQSY